VDISVLSYILLRWYERQGWTLSLGLLSCSPIHVPLPSEVWPRYLAGISYLYAVFVLYGPQLIGFQKLLRLDLGGTSLGSASDRAEGTSVSENSKDAAAIPLTLKLVASEDGFVAPFELRALREERLFALMLWFNASFTLAGQVCEPGAPSGFITMTLMAFISHDVGFQASRVDVWSW